MMLRYKILIKKEEEKVNIEIQYNQQKLASFHSQRSIPIVRLKTCQYLFTAKFYRLRANFCSRRKISL